MIPSISDDVDAELDHGLYRPGRTRLYQDPANYHYGNSGRSKEERWHIRVTLNRL